MKTLVVFSRESDTLADIKGRALRLGLEVHWFPVDEWSMHLDELMHSAGVIVDEVDPDFARSATVSDLEEWLLEGANAPLWMFLVPNGSRRLDRCVCYKSGRFVHHQHETFDDSTLLAFHDQEAIAS